MQRLTVSALAAIFLMSSSSARANTRTLSDATLKHYGKALAHWMNVRESCGDGGRFQGAPSLVQQSLQSYQAVARRLRGYSSAAYTGLSTDFVSRGNQASTFLVPGVTNSITLTIQVRSAISNLQAMATAISQRIAEVDPGMAGPYRIVLRGIQAALAQARAASRVIGCRRAEDEINYVVARTVNSVPDDSPVDLPNTLESSPLIVRGEACSTLEDVATHLSGIIQDSNEAILHERSYYERAVASQMVVEYLRKHGGREGRLDARRDSRLRDMTNDLVSRYIRHEERLAAREARRTAARAPAAEPDDGEE